MRMDTQIIQTLRFHLITQHNNTHTPGISYRARQLNMKLRAHTRSWDSSKIFEASVHSGVVELPGNFVPFFVTI